LRIAISDLQGRVDRMRNGPEKQRLQAALTALGTEGDHNGVNVTFHSLEDDAAANTALQSNEIGQLTFTVAFDPNKISGSNEWAGL
jgi:hypothetical protein